MWEGRPGRGARGGGRGGELEVMGEEGSWRRQRRGGDQSEREKDRGERRRGMVWDRK